MKKIFFSGLVLFSLAVSAQEASEIKPAAKGVIYGTAISENGEAISPNDIQSKMANNVFEGKITGKVKEVCKAMGCWIKLEKADGSSLMVKSKDHSFFMPENLVGKTVVIEGTASIKEESEEKRKHYAKDAGKSKEEIKKIKGSGKEVQFVASGVKVLD
ncbi:MAG: DUF4920 domain-containing protein [Bacteroidota bacterium]|nr:DUF4920 domain-containing protein [Bacteroidota bacterium]